MNNSGRQAKDRINTPEQKMKPIRVLHSTHFFSHAEVTSRTARSKLRQAFLQCDATARISAAAVPSLRRRANSGPIGWLQLATPLAISFASASDQLLPPF